MPIATIQSEQHHPQSHQRTPLSDIHRAKRCVYTQMYHKFVHLHSAKVNRTYICVCTVYTHNDESNAVGFVSEFLVFTDTK